MEQGEGPGDEDGGAWEAVDGSGETYVYPTRVGLDLGDDNYPSYTVDGPNHEERAKELAAWLNTGETPIRQAVHASALMSIMAELSDLYARAAAIVEGLGVAHTRVADALMAADLDEEADR
jgi:hypothetical protein